MFNIGRRWNIKNTKQLKKFGRSCPIWNELENVSDDEKNDETALKFIFVVDEIERKNLYNKILSREINLPKLSQQLLGFKSFTSFKYYEYVRDPRSKGKDLRCEYCELFDPYALILTHMAIDHGVSGGYNFCSYCRYLTVESTFQL